MVTSVKSSPKVVCITGASSGIGRALAYEYAKKNHVLVLCGRKQKTLTTASNECKKRGAVEVKNIILDYKHTIQCVDRVKKIAGNVDVVILCAGVSQRATVLETQNDVMNTLFTVNALTPMAITKEFVSVWQKHKDDNKSTKQLAVVSSVASVAPIPLRSSYCAAKKALELYVQTMANEFVSSKYQQKLQNKTIQKITITRIIPGFVDTNVSYNALTAQGKVWATLDKNQKKGISAKKAAQKIIKKLEKKHVPQEVYVGMNVFLWLLVFISKTFPMMANFLLSRIKTT